MSAPKIDLALIRSLLEQDPCGLNEESAIAIHEQLAALAQYQTDASRKIAAQESELTALRKERGGLREALARLSNYPSTRADELSASSMRWIAREALAAYDARGAQEEVALTDEQIIEVRDECLPNQGERFDCLAFARAILARAALKEAE